MRGGASSVVYAPGPAPGDPAALGAFVSAELDRIARALVQLAAGHVDQTYSPPDKPRAGDIRLADGVSWDPVSAGAPRFVGFADGAWRLLG